MNKRVKIAILIALIGVIFILALQALWMSISYKLEEKKLIQRAASLTEEAVHAVILNNSSVWWNSIQERFGKDIRPFKGGLSYKDSIVTMQVFNPINELYNKFERKCKNGAELTKYGLGTYMLYHVCGLDLELLNLQLDSAFHKNSIYIPYIIEKVDTRTGRVETRSHSRLPYDDFTTVCDTVRLGIVGSDGVVVKFDGSYAGMIKQIRFIILSSFVITLFVAILLFCIIRIIVYQQQLSDFRENFVRHMVHEIKNPITYLKRVLEFPDENDMDKRLRTASAKINHINLLIEKLLTTTSNRLDIQKQPIDIRETLDKIRASYPDADLRMEVKEDISTFRADPVHYGNALLNLIDNAIKYSSGAKRVSVHCYREKNDVYVSVRDWGIGIPVEFQLLIFDRYFRVPRRKSVNVSGFGLGLSYVRMVAKAHGGEVTLSSIYKQGSLFTIRIPYDDK